MKLQVTCKRSYRTFAKNIFDGAIKLECLRTTEPLRTFGLQNLQNKKLSMSLSDLRTFGLTNLRNEEPFISDLRTFGLQNIQNKKLSVSLSDLRTFGLTNLRNEEPFISDLRTFGLQNLRTREQSPWWPGLTPWFRTTEPSDYKTFGLESSHHGGEVCRHAIGCIIRLYIVCLACALQCWLYTHYVCVASECIDVFIPGIVCQYTNAILTT